MTVFFVGKSRVDEEVFFFSKAKIVSSRNMDKKQ
jgi:hypothetical protein